VIHLEIGDSQKILRNDIKIIVMGEGEAAAGINLKVIDKIVQ